MKKIICVVLITIISLLQFSVVFADTVNSLQFSDVESQVLLHNPDIQADHVVNDNGDLNNSIINLQNLKDIISIAMADMADKSSTINSSSLDGPTKDYLGDVYERMITIYNATLGQLQGQINSLRAQLSNNVYSPSRVISQNSIVWSTQQLYLMYSSLQLQEEELVNKSKQIENKKKIASLQKELGMISDMDFQELTAQANDANASVKAISDNMMGIKGQLNLLMGQDFDIPLSLGGLPPVGNNSVSAINYSKDYDTALAESLNIKLLGSQNKYRRDKEIRKFELTFDQKYKDVFNKKDVFDSEAAKLGREDRKLSAAKLKFDAGLISRTDYENLVYSLKTQSIKVKTAQLELFKSLTVYQWLLRGYEASI